MKGIQRWNKVRQRLSSITAEELDISFISCPVHVKTTYSKIKGSFFKVTLNREIIWIFPKDTEQDKKYLRGFFNGVWSVWEYPISSIIKYLDLPKEELLHYEDKAGIADILKACDKRIGYYRLNTLELSPAAKKVFEERFKNKNNSENIVLNNNNLNL